MLRKTKNHWFSLLIIIIVFVFSISSFIYAAWQEPSLSPPDGNVAAPLNVGNVGQSKMGGLILNTGGASNGLIVQSGNVGIGTLNPDSGAILNLDSRGTGNDLQIRMRNKLSAEIGDQYSSITSRRLGSGRSELLFGTTSGGIHNTRVTIDDNGNVGIGTSNPGAKLEIAGQIKITGGIPGVGKVLTTTDASGLASWQTPSSTSLPPGQASDTLRHDGTGWVANNILQNNGTGVGVGIANAGGRLTVHALGPGANPDSALVLIRNGGGGFPTYFRIGQDNILVVNNSNEDTLFLDDGNMGIGAAPSYFASGNNLEIAGQIKITGGIPGVGKVLTSDSNGLASWQNPSGGGGLPSGTANQTLRHNGTDWVANSFLYSAGNKVGIGDISPTALLSVSTETGGPFAVGTRSLQVGNTDFIVAWNGNVGIGEAPYEENNYFGDYTDKRLVVSGGSIVGEQNLYVQSPLSPSIVVGVGELQYALQNWQGKTVYGIGWDAASGKIGVSMPSGTTFGYWQWSGNPINVFVSGSLGVGTGGVTDNELIARLAVRTPLSGPGPNAFQVPFAINSSDVWTKFYNVSGSNNSVIQVMAGGNETGFGSTGYNLLLNPNGGNVGIGAGAPSTKLHIANTAIDGDIVRLQDSDGSCLLNPEAGTLNITCSSDARLKTGITSTGSVLGKMMGLKIRDFIVKSSGKNQRFNLCLKYL